MLTEDDSAPCSRKISAGGGRRSPPWAAARKPVLSGTSAGGGGSSSACRVWGRGCGGGDAGAAARRKNGVETDLLRGWAGSRGEENSLPGVTRPIEETSRSLAGGDCGGIERSAATAEGRGKIAWGVAGPNVRVF
uniref:DUF834 domain-containing protein n=1 Tax=Oryza brachyantha TaxID=4533 RepID=J3LDC3_ORYBR